MKNDEGAVVTIYFFNWFIFKHSFIRKKTPGHGKSGDMCIVCCNRKGHHSSIHAQKLNVEWLSWTFYHNGWSWFTTITAVSLPLGHRVSTAQDCTAYHRSSVLKTEYLKVTILYYTQSSLQNNSPIPSYIFPLWRWHCQWYLLVAKAVHQHDIL